LLRFCSIAWPLIAVPARSRNKRRSFSVRGESGFYEGKSYENDSGWHLIHATLGAPSWDKDLAMNDQIDILDEPISDEELEAAGGGPMIVGSLAGTFWTLCKWIGGCKPPRAHAFVTAVPVTTRYSK
jgi:hypothetical protein